jgi:hypothetical protein
MLTPYTSQQPVDDFGLRFSNLQVSASLAATTDTAWTIPNAAPRYKAIINSSGAVWVALQPKGTPSIVAAVPVGASFATTTSELVSGKLCRDVRAGDTLHFFTSTASTNVSIVLYSEYTNN